VHLHELLGQALEKLVRVQKSSSAVRDLMVKYRRDTKASNIGSQSKTPNRSKNEEFPGVEEINATRDVDLISVIRRTRFLH
jgi:hypothetical protein